MSYETLTILFNKIIATYSHQIPIMAGLAALFTVLAVFKSQTSNPGKVWWRNPGLATDLTYGLVHALIGPYFRVPGRVFGVRLYAIRFAYSSTLCKPAGTKGADWRTKLDFRVPDPVLE